MEDILFDLYYKSAHRNEELEQTIEELQGKLKYRRNENIRLAEENKKLKKEIDRLHEVIDIKDNERIKLVKENKELQHRIDDLQSELTDAKNDYKQASNEIKLINKNLDRQLEVVDNITEIAKKQHDDINKITEENNELKCRLKILNKAFLNSIYGITGTIYTDTDSIKETKNNDSNN